MSNKKKCLNQVKRGPKLKGQTKKIVQSIRVESHLLDEIKGMNQTAQKIFDSVIYGEGFEKNVCWGIGTKSNRDSSGECDTSQFEQDRII